MQRFDQGFMQRFDQGFMQRFDQGFMQWVEQGFMKWFNQGFNQGFMKCSLQEYILNILHTKYIFNFSDFYSIVFIGHFLKGSVEKHFKQRFYETV
jgi:hypothetical protein